MKFLIAALLSKANFFTFLGDVPGISHATLFSEEHVSTGTRLGRLSLILVPASSLMSLSGEAAVPLTELVLVFVVSEELSASTYKTYKMIVFTNHSLFPLHELASQIIWIACNNTVHKINVFIQMLFFRAGTQTHFHTCRSWNYNSISSHLFNIVPLLVFSFGMIHDFELPLVEDSGTSPFNADSRLKRTSLIM